MADATVTQLSTMLEGEQYASLTSYRKNGNDISSPVWFAEQDGKIYVTTMADSWKVKRIRNNGHVKLAACNARGIVHSETIKGIASLHEAGSPIAKKADGALSRKYGLMKRLFEFMWWIRGKQAIFIEITPQ